MKSSSVYGNMSKDVIQSQIPQVYLLFHRKKKSVLFVISYFRQISFSTLKKTLPIAFLHGLKQLTQSVRTSLNSHFN